MSGWSLVAVFFAFRLRPGLLLGINGFSWFSDWNPKVQKHVSLVDLVKSFPTIIYLQNLASIQPRTSLSKFGGKFNSEKVGKIKESQNDAE